MVRSLKKHFRGGVRSSTKEEFVVWGWFVGVLYCGTAKVYEFDLEVFVDDKIFVFNVSMIDSLTIEVMYSLDHLGHDIPGLFL